MKNFLDREESKKNKDKVVEKKANKDQVISLKEKVVNRKIISILLVFVIALGTFSFLGLGGKNLLSNLRDLFDGNQEIGRKTITPNKIGEQFDGTYKLSLTVTGDASTEKTVSSANVLVVFDTSNSMSDNRSRIHMKYDTGRYGLVNGQYLNLYSAQNNNSQLNNDTFDGTVYVKNGNSFTEYTGQRYVYTRRAEAGEKVIYDFTHDLFRYQDKENNPENIQMALISFNHTAHEIQDWTSTEKDITKKLSPTGLYGTKQIANSSGTNYEVALQSAINDYLSTADGDPTFVIFITDGAPTQVAGTANGVYDDPEDCYGAAKDEALTIQRYDTSKHEADANSSNTTLYGIYAYGNEADYLDDIIYYAHNNGESRDNERPETDSTDYYYNASDTAALTAAVGDIFSDIVDTLGIGNVSIKDGTTTNVQTSQGISHLLTIDENSYEYWLSIPITNNEMKRVDVVSGEEYTITLSDNGDGTFKASSSKWSDVTITGKIENGVFKYKWTESNNFYKFNPPSASFNSSTGYVDWNLASVGTLLDGVTYEVTFDVYPSQETYDLIADLKNDKIDYDTEVDPAIKKYLHKNGDSYSLDTNTVDENGNSTATITYTDTRTDDGEQTYTYTNPDPVATDASSISIKKTWDNDLDTRTERPVSVNLQRDGENFYPAELNAANNFELKDIAIAVGLARLNGETLTVLDTGHDYKFAELGSESYNWELETETVHPMLINGEIKKLILVEDESTIPSAMGDKTYYDGYYKLGNKYYKDEGTNPTIHAINHRRSNFNVKKKVNGENANPNDTFEFTIRVTQKGEDGQAIADDTTTNNDDIWFSICDTEIDSTCKDPNSLVKDESLVTGAQKEMRDGAWTGYYYVTNTTEVKVKLKDKYNLRFTNLLSNTDFSVVEGNTTNYELEKIETTSGFDSNKDRKSISGKTITGHIGQSNKIYQVEYTNKNTNPETVDASVMKVWNDNDDQDGIRPDTLTVTLSNGQTATLSDDNDWSATITGLPKWKDGEEVEYTWSEESLPDGYEMVSNNTVGTLTTITNKHESYKTNISVEKVWDDENNQDGLRTAIEVELFKIIDNVESTTGKTQTLNAGNNWFYEFTGLDKNADGVPILYIVRENTRLAGYEAPIYSNPINEGKVTITNKHTPYTKNVGVKKVWDDERNQDGKRPTELSVKLMAGDEIVTTVKLNEGNQWTQVVNVPLNKDGEEVEYTWVEESIEGYKLTDTDVTTLEDETILTSITNKYEPAKDTIVVTKVWEDANDQDGIRPDDVTFTVTGSDGKTYTKTFSGQGNRWTQEVEVDKYYNGGQEVTFTVDEANVSSYTKSIDNSKLTITNTHEPEKDTITVTKIWDDSSDQDGKRPENVTFTVTGSDGKTYTKTFGGQGNTWTQEVEVDKLYDGGKEVTFTVDEADVNGYTKSINNDNLTITNSYTTKTTSLTVTKVWDDAGDQDGKRSDVNAKVTLYADGTAVDRADATVDVSTAAGWSKTWSNLPVFKGGKEITYSVRETFNENSGYTKSGDGSNLKASEDSTSLGTVTITNKYTPEKDTITVTKIWDDANDQDRIRPDDVTFTVTGSDGKTYTETFSGSGNTWTKEIKVNKYYNGGQEVTFTVDEANVSSYTKSIDNSKLTITNSYQPAKTSVSVEKVWDDNNNQDGLRAAIEVELFKIINNIESTTGKKATLDETNNWFATFTGLDKNADGVPILYTVRENTKLTDYEEPVYSAPVSEGKVTITNKHTAYTTSVSVKKVWDDASNQDGKRPDSITVTLMDGDDEVKDVTLSESNSWTATVSGLPLNRDGKAIEYTWVEKNVPDGYKLTGNSTKDSLTTITNTHEPKMINIPVKKEWDNSKNKFGFDNPTKVKVYLKDGDTILEDATLEEANNWSATFNNYPMYKDGKEIAYMVEEEALADYITDISGNPTNGFVIKNTYSPELINIGVNKEWADNSDQDGIRPTSIYVKLIGKVGEDTVYTSERTEISDLNTKDTWSYTFEKLPSTYYGEKITYSVEEEKVDGYDTPSYSGDIKTNLIVTNPYVPQTISYHVTKAWDDNDDHDGIRPESITVILKADGEKIDEKVLNEENGWSYEFIDLPKYKDHGTSISYTIEEVTVDKYESSISVNDEGTSAVITNKHDNEKVYIDITKSWDDNNNELGLRPDSITVNILANGEIYKTVKLTSENNWKITVEVDKYIDKEEAVYTIDEVSVNDYISTINGFNIINKLNHTEIVPPNTLVEVNNTSDGLISIITVLTTLGVTALSIRKRYE